MFVAGYSVERDLGAGFAKSDAVALLAATVA